MFILSKLTKVFIENVINIEHLSKMFATCKIYNFASLHVSKADKPLQSVHTPSARPSICLSTVCQSIIMCLVQSVVGI